MTLNIKNPKTHELIKELSEMTGESLTEAVTVAVQERLERLRRDQHSVGLAERLMAIGRDSAPRWREPYKSMEHGDLLYNDKGLPK